MAYKDVYQAWQSDPEGFWMQAAEAIDWTEKPSKALFDDKAPLYEWFRDGQVNTCWNAVDRHVEAGRGEQLAIIHDSPVTHSTKGITYRELQARVASLAGALRAKGVEKGDRVIIYMPMIPEALEAMLACARLGAIHSVVFGGFAAHELAVRIDDCQPKAIIAASCGIEPGRVVHYKPLVDAAIDLARHKPDFCVIFQREQEVAKLTEGRDFAWHSFQYGVEPAECVPVSGDHPVYILYTSGTTGQPKGVVRPTGGHLVALQWSMKNIYNIEAGDVFWAASDVGWVVGHSYICYGPLIAGATTIVFEGKPVGTPDAGTFWRVIQNHKVKSFFTAPTALRAIKHGQRAAEALNDDLGAIAVLPALILPFAGLQLAFDEYLAALFQVAFDHADQPFGKDRNRVPLGLFLAFAGLAIFPRFRCGDPQIGDLAAVLKTANFGIGPQIADQHDLVERTRHRNVPSRQKLARANARLLRAS